MMSIWHFVEYLEDAVPEDRPLLPKDPFERNKQRLLIDIFSRKVMSR